MADGPIYFLSDIHLGSKYDKENAREKALVEFLRSLPSNTEAVYLLGDVFDFWVEYKDVIPKGYTRVLGELARLSDSGVKISFFRGNHDYWIIDYFQKEIGMKVIDEPYIIEEINGLRICLGHGDGLGRQSAKNRFIFSLFRNRFCIGLLKSLHPRLIFDFARCWSSNSRRKHLKSPYHFKGEEDLLYIFAEGIGSKGHIDYYIFGHLHDRAEIDVRNGGRMFILDDWGNGANYIRLDGDGITLIA